MSNFLCAPSLLIIVVLLSFASCSSPKTSVYVNELTQKSNNKSSNKLEQITNLWVGHFSNKASLEEGNSQVNVEQEIIGRRIWEKERFGEYWIYTGWFQADSYESALSSSIAQVTKISPDTAFITFYRIKEGVTIDEYEWRKAQPFNNLRRVDLESSGEGCGSYLVKSGDGAYRVIANNPCYNPISENIQYYKIDATLKEAGIVFNTKFLDEKFNVLVHYKDNEFLRYTKAELEEKYKSFVLAE
jgi:hypothetical protein